MLVPDHSKLELSCKRCHGLELVPSRGLNSGIYRDNPRYESLSPLLLAIFLITNGLRNLQTNQA